MPKNLPVLLFILLLSACGSGGTSSSSGEEMAERTLDCVVEEAALLIAEGSSCFITQSLLANYAIPQTSLGISIGTELFCTDGDIVFPNRTTTLIQTFDFEPTMQAGVIITCEDTEIANLPPPPLSPPQEKPAYWQF